MEDDQGKEMMITKETYSQAIARARKDKRLHVSDCVFLYTFIFILDERGETYTDLPMSALVEETGLSMGAVNDAIKHLMDCEYLEGDLHLNPGHRRKNYRLWLFGTSGPIENSSRHLEGKRLLCTYHSNHSIFEHGTGTPRNQQEGNVDDADDTKKL